MRIENTTPVAGRTAQPSDKVDLALKKVCDEFESLLVAQLLKSMRATVPKSDLFGSPEKEEIFRSMLDDETAKSIASGGAMGIGKMLYTQLSGRRAAKVPTESVDK